MKGSNAQRGDTLAESQILTSKSIDLEMSAVKPDKSLTV